jgi:hypothetical protein
MLTKMPDQMDLRHKPNQFKPGSAFHEASQGKEFLYILGSSFLEKPFHSYLCRDVKGCEGL